MSFVKESRSIVFQTGKQSTVVLGEKFVPSKTQKKGNSKKYSCSVSRKGMLLSNPQASGFENNAFSFYRDEEPVQRDAQNPLTWVYQITLLSPAIMASQPLLRPETLSPPFTHENLWITSRCVEAALNVYSFVKKSKSLSEGILDTLICN